MNWRKPELLGKRWVVMTLPANIDKKTVALSPKYPIRHLLPISQVITLQKENAVYPTYRVIKCFNSSQVRVLSLRSILLHIFHRIKPKGADQVQHGTVTCVLSTPPRRIEKRPYQTYRIIPNGD